MLEFFSNSVQRIVYQKRNEKSPQDYSFFLVPDSSLIFVSEIRHIMSLTDLDSIINAIEVYLKSDDTC